MTTLKMLDPQQGRVGGYLVVWGNPDQPDLHGDFFTPNTDFSLDWFEVRPLLYQHGLDSAIKTDLIGQLDTLHTDKVGLWAEAQLDLHHDYAKAVLDLVQRGALGWSSGSLSHLVQRQPDGHITRWPLVEGSLTPTPAEPRLTDAKALKDAFAALGLDDSRLFSSVVEASAAPVFQSQPTAEGDPKPMKRLPTSTQDVLSPTPSLHVSSPFDSLSADDLLHGYMLLRHVKGFRGVSDRYANALAYKLNRANPAIKSDELSHTAQTGYGDEWAAELWSASVWQKARTDNVVLPLFAAVEMPSNPFELPIEGADPTVYYVGETTDEDMLSLGTNNPIPDSKIGTAKLTLNAKKLALRVGFSSELVEDAVVPLLALYREQATRAIADSIDHVLLNGDIAASGNVNLDGGSPAANTRYRAFDGLRKTALANDHDANGAPSLALMRAARFTMPPRYAARPSDLAWIVDGNTYAAMLGMSEFLTVDKAGSQATALTGQIGFADGAPVMMSAEMPTTTAANGKVSSTALDNTQGSAVCVYRPGWVVGYRRHINVSVDYLPYYDAYQLTATVRLALGRMDTGAASALRNITI